MIGFISNVTFKPREGEKELEKLDFVPVCSSKIHADEDRPPATMAVWRRQKSCGHMPVPLFRFICDDCWKMNTEIVPVQKCITCKKPFTFIDSVIRWFRL